MLIHIEQSSFDALPYFFMRFFNFVVSPLLFYFRKVTMKKTIKGNFMFRVSMYP